MRIKHEIYLKEKQRQLERVEEVVGGEGAAVGAYL